MVSKQQVEELASMVRVELTDSEVDTLRSELSHMLAFAAKLEDVDVTGVPEWTPPAPEGRSLRADVPATSLPQQEALALAAATQDGYFKVPRTLDEG